MEEKSQRVVKEGNAFYEIDLECLEKRKKKKSGSKSSSRKKGRGSKPSAFINFSIRIRCCRTAEEVPLKSSSCQCRIRIRFSQSRCCRTGSLR